VLTQIALAHEKLGRWLERPAEYADHSNEKLDHLYGFATRILLVPIAIAILLPVAIPLIVVSLPRFFWWCYWYYARAREIEPFKVSQKSEAEALSFLFTRARDKLRTIPCRPAEYQDIAAAPCLDPSTICIPEVDINFLPNTIDVAGLDVPLAPLLRPLLRPRVRVTGYWWIGTSRGTAAAAINLRKWVFTYTSGGPPKLGSKFKVLSDPGTDRDRQLYRFALDVLVKAARA
ncbi:MAG: hypothetical protein JOZ60_00005, partial [Verrucomicrobia bacterium]|nr:hypothetical protein [Verrucomicrobiota bacterium]